MKKHILCILLLLSLLLGMALPAGAVSGTIVPPTYPGTQTGLPFSIRSANGRVTEGTAEFLVSYSVDTQGDILYFQQKHLGMLTLYAAPNGKQPITITSGKGLPVMLEQKYTRLYARFVQNGSGLVSNYTITLLSPRSAVEYRDELVISDWAFGAFHYCNNEGFGYIRGDEKGNAAPDANMTRYEMATVSSRFLGTDRSQFGKVNNPYEDKLVNWAEDAVSVLTELDVISGHKVKGKYYYRGDNNVTREEVAKIFVNLLLLQEGKGRTAEEIYRLHKKDYDARLAKFGDNDKISDWAHPYMAVAVCYYGFMKGSAEKGGTYLRPGANITREEMTAMIARRSEYEIKPMLSTLIADYRTLYNKASEYPEVLRKPFVSAYTAAKNALSGKDTAKMERCYGKLYRTMLMMTQPKLIYLSPSGQMSNLYTGVNTNEGAQMQQVAKLLAPMLEQKGFRVYTADVNTSLEDRAKEAKRMGADLYVAIHSNATGGKNDGSGQGSIVFHSNNPGSERLARCVSKYLSALTPTADRGYKNDSLTSLPYKEIRFPEMTNVLAEVEFHDYKPYAEWIIANRAKIAKAFCDAIWEYYYG